MRLTTEICGAGTRQLLGPRRSAPRLWDVFVNVADGRCQFKARHIPRWRANGQRSLLQKADARP